MYFVYLLKSIKYNKTYTGISDNISRRLKQHNQGLHPYTKRYMPWKLLYFEQLENRINARIKEKYFKSAAGRRWIKNKLFTKALVSN